MEFYRDVHRSLCYYLVDSRKFSNCRESKEILEFCKDVHQFLGCLIREIPDLKGIQGNFGVQRECESVPLLLLDRKSSNRRASKRILEFYKDVHQYFGYYSGHSRIEGISREFSGSRRMFTSPNCSEFRSFGVPHRCPVVSMIFNSIIFVSNSLIFLLILFPGLR